MSYSPATKRCEFCEKVFGPRRNMGQMRWTRQRFCSKACAQRTVPEISCLGCGGRFQPDRHRTKFCSSSCFGTWNISKNLAGTLKHPRHKGGFSYSTRDRRWLINCRDGTQVRYARAVVEADLQRELKPQEVVHHINGNPTDDRIENLQLLTSQSEHAKLHGLGTHIRVKLNG